MELKDDLLKDFDTLPVAFLLQGINAPFHFCIPSFQRGYRWESKHVLDMLNDIYGFAQSNNKAYFLQPLVVRRMTGNNCWEVLDGQQRLTTIYLILKRFMKRIIEDDRDLYTLYDIKYMERDTPEFAKLNPKNNLDCFYLYRAEQTIENWYNEHKSSTTSLDKMKDVLFAADCDKKVKFIWYVIQEKTTDMEYADLTAINVFNRLNKGKISLTSSELIKALFIIHVKSQANPVVNLDRFALEWDSMEKQFQRDEFWYFISNRKNDIETRIDVLFDFIANVDYRTSDPLDTYRYFQNIYDNLSSNNIVDKYESFQQLWQDVKKRYDLFLRWFEDSKVYNYVGYLVCEGVLPRFIFDRIERERHLTTDYNEDRLINTLRTIIKETIGYNAYYNKTQRGFEDWVYSDKSDYKKIQQLLLLFNIETYIKSNTKFPFDDFQKGDWDVEHIDSQKDNTMQKISDKIEWIKLVNDQLQYDTTQQAIDLFEHGKKILDELNSEQEDHNIFSPFYESVFAYYNGNSSTSDKDTIDNLTLLNCGINRSYKNAPFPYKRSVIIQNDRNGVFVPMCTRNLFLKYYTGAEHGASQLDIIRWSDADRTAYSKNLRTTLNFYLQ